MHIAITYDSPIPAHGYGGTERIAWWLGRHLNRLGHRVTYVVPPGSTCDFAQVVIYDRDRPIESRIPADVDFIHDFGPLTRPVGYPSLTTFHGNGHPGLRLPRNTVFLCRNHAERHGGSVFVYNGIDPDDYGPVDWSASRDHLLFLAMAAWKVKNVRGSIRIARRARQRLAVVGGSRVNVRMGVRVTLDPRVRFHGVIGGDRKHRIINRSSALLFPVRWHEPFGIAMVEALYFGCPVYGTTYGSLPEIVTPDVGFLADTESILADELRDIGRFDRRRCHQYAVDNFSAALMTQRYLALYERVLNGESLHEAEPIMAEGAEEGLLPMGR